ncbi:MAG: hypothetical protein RSD39_04810 [Oscillospiraceae bacterium]
MGKECLNMGDKNPKKTKKKKKAAEKTASGSTAAEIAALPSQQAAKRPGK